MESTAVLEPARTWTLGLRVKVEMRESCSQTGRGGPRVTLEAVWGFKPGHLIVGFIYTFKAHSGHSLGPELVSKGRMETDKLIRKPL